MNGKDKLALLSIGLTIVFCVLIWYSGAPWFVFGAYFLGRLRQLLET
jgi:hypothetical protein